MEMIDVNLPEKVYCISEGKKYEAGKDTSGYDLGCARLEIGNGSVFIGAAGKAPEKVILEWSFSLGGNALIKGDAWERSYGELCFEKIDPEKVMPWYFIAVVGGKTYGFGVKTGANCFAFWKCSGKKITLTLDIRCGTEGVMLCGRTLEAAKIVTHVSEKEPFYAERDFCGMMCENVKMPETPVYGGNDWYCNYGRNSYDNILLHAKRVSECAKDNKVRPYMTIDDGWQLTHALMPEFNGGPWRFCNRKFGDMEKTASAIRNEGAIPGIWYRPLQTAEYLPHECFLERETGSVLRFLDPSNPAAKEYIRSETESLLSRGFGLIKHDFSTFDVFGRWGNCFGDDLTDGKWSFYDKTKTTAEILKELYTLISDTARGRAVVIGCNVVGHLSAGIHELQRIGNDTSGREWKYTVKNGVNTLAYRLPQHGKFFAADADCVGITDMIPWEKNRMWLDILSRSATPLFVSIKEDCYGEKQKEALTEAFRLSGNAYNLKNELIPCEPENKTPTVWKYGEEKLRYDWDV